MISELGCAESLKTILIGICHVNAGSAQPRNCLNVTRPFPILWVESGDSRSTMYIIYSWSIDVYNVHNIQLVTFDAILLPSLPFVADETFTKGKTETAWIQCGPGGEGDMSTS